MIEILTAFFDVFYWPIDPANLYFEENPIMICLTAILLCMGISRIFFLLFRGGRS